MTDDELRFEDALFNALHRLPFWAFIRRGKLRERIELLQATTK